MAHADFVHLRVHTAFSLLEGALKVDDVVKLCRTMAMPAVAMTDTDNLFGALEFSLSCASQGVQPITGCQLSIRRPEGEAGEGFQNGHRNGRTLLADQLVVLVQNETGYLNLLQLVTKLHLDSEGGEERRLGLDDLSGRTEGLIALTGGPAGAVGRLLGEGQTSEAEDCLTQLAGLFSGRLYVELMRHGLDIERQIEPELVELAFRHDLPLVATNECFFSAEDMYEAHDALICIADGAYVSQTGRRRLTPNHRFKTPQEMRALFADLPEAVDNTLAIARRCGFLVQTRDPLLPDYAKNGEQDEAKLLAESARAGLEERLEVQLFTDDMDAEQKSAVATPYRERMEYELGVIADMGFPGYFLIVADFIQWAKSQDIPVGPGRGSGAGSVVAWALTITDLDPLRFGLLFERFLNPERVSMPDFDVDFCQDRRDEVIRYVQEKYGADQVAQIITFGTLQPRAALRDVGRVLQMPYPLVDRICKLVPNNPASPVTLAQAIKLEPQLQNMIDEDDTVAKLVEIAGKLEGLYRHASTHAAGLVIGDRPLVELVPLYRDPRSEIPVTQFSMKWVEAAGLVKFDFLGLKTLTVLSTAVGFLRDRGVEIDLARIPLDDQLTFEMLGRGESTGLFQLESAGMRDILRNMKIDRFDDIIAIVSLYRPGPMDDIPSYIRRKTGDEAPDYLYPSIESILKETYGIIVYQEQVMQIAQEMAGYTLGGADLLRRAMGKKIPAEMEAQRKIFMDGATARTVPEGTASNIFDKMAKFAGYGFNKCHAGPYALVAYQTAYLKANYPVEFMAASMTLDIHNTDKLNTFHRELKRLGFELLPPDTNASNATFRVESLADGTGAVRYALGAIKNVGTAAMEAVVEEREQNGAFADISDFVERLDTRIVNKRQMENIIRAGAFDCLNPNRRQLFTGLELMMRQAGTAMSERESGQFGLFGDGESAFHQSIALPDTADWDPLERLQEEFDAVGIHLSAHPLDPHEKGLNRLGVMPYAEAMARHKDGIVKLAGTVTGKRERTSARGNRYAFVQLSDASGDYEVTVFSEQLAAARDDLEPGNCLYLQATMQFEGETSRITVQAISRLEEATSDLASGLKVFVDDAAPLPALREVLNREGRGRGEVVLVSRLGLDAEVEVRLPGRFAVSPVVAQAVKSIPGIVEVQET